MCGLNALDFAGVKHLRFPRERRAGGARALGEDLGDVAEILGARPIALKLSGHRQPSDRLGARADETTVGNVVCLHPHTARPLPTTHHIAPPLTSYTLP